MGVLALTAVLLAGLHHGARMHAPDHPVAVTRTASPSPGRARATTRRVPAAVAKWQLVASVARAAGLPHAARAMRHYLAATGTTLPVDPAAIVAAEPELRGLVRAAVASAAGAGPGPFQTPWQRYVTSSMDWHFALGSIEYRVEGSVGGRGSVRYRVTVRDHYDWDAPGSVHVPGLGLVRNAELRALARRGLARVYAVAGRSRVLRGP